MCVRYVLGHVIHNFWIALQNGYTHLTSTNCRWEPTAVWHRKSSQTHWDSRAPREVILTWLLASPQEVEDRKTMAALVGHFLGSQPFNIGPRMSPGGPVLPWPAHLCLLGFNLFQTLLLMCQVQMGAWHGHLPSTSTRIKSCAAAAADLQ